LTGLSSGSKSYYAKSKGTKKCAGTTMTVTCEQIHPIVGIGPAPEQQASKYQSNIVFPIRNPITAIPAHHQAKAVSSIHVLYSVNVDSAYLLPFFPLLHTLPKNLFL